MPHNMVVTFLGTTSGGGPSDSRNCSSLVLDAIGDGSLWMVDCAEGTVRQVESQPFVNFDRVKMKSITKIFITHMHADHTMGLITLLRFILGFSKPSQTQTNASSGPSRQPPARVEVYGPVGIRQFIRTIFSLTHTRSADRFAVHELLAAGESPSVSCDPDKLHANENPGRDIVCDKEGFWRAIVDIQCAYSNEWVVVDAGPIQHRDPCIGYIVREFPALSHANTAASSSLRTLVILGDTNDPSAILPLIDSPVSLLIHEATDTLIPPHIDPLQRTGRNRTIEGVLAVTLERGHSTPAMAGAFARRIGAERLVLNHIGARFPAPAFPPKTQVDHFRLACMLEIERQATEAWHAPFGQCAEAAYDYYRIIIPPRPAPTYVTKSARSIQEHTSRGPQSGVRSLPAETRQPKVIVEDDDVVIIEGPERDALLRKQAQVPTPHRSASSGRRGTGQIPKRTSQGREWYQRGQYNGDVDGQRSDSNEERFRPSRSHEYADKKLRR